MVNWNFTLKILKIKLAIYSLKKTSSPGQPRHCLQRPWYLVPPRKMLNQISWSFQIYLKASLHILFETLYVEPIKKQIQSILNSNFNISASYNIVVTLSILTFSNHVQAAFTWFHLNSSSYKEDLSMTTYYSCTIDYLNNLSSSPTFSHPSVILCNVICNSVNLHMNTDVNQLNSTTFSWILNILFWLAWNSIVDSNKTNPQLIIKAIPFNPCFRHPSLPHSLSFEHQHYPGMCLKSH